MHYRSDWVESILQGYFSFSAPSTRTDAYNICNLYSWVIPNYYISVQLYVFAKMDHGRKASPSNAKRYGKNNYFFIILIKNSRDKNIIIIILKWLVYPRIFRFWSEYFYNSKF